MSDNWIVSCPRCHKDIFTTNEEPVKCQVMEHRHFRHMDGRQVVRTDAYGCVHCGCSFHSHPPVPGRDTREVAHAPE